MIYKTILSAVTFLSILNCSSQKQILKTTDSAETVSTKPKAEVFREDEKNIVYLNEGENKFLKEYQMNVTFKNISEDSRCPEGVTCVWAGVAVANIEFMSTTSRPVTMQIASTNVAGKNLQKTVSFNGFNITLKHVSPTPGAKDGTKNLPGKYRIGLSFSKM